MEIKTLAQILAENPENDERSSKKNAPSQPKSKPHQKPRAQTSSARGLAVSKNIHSRTSHTINSDLISADSPAPDVIETQNPEINQPKLTQQAFTDNHYGHNDDKGIDRDKRDKYKKSRPKRNSAKKKKVFHPASAYQSKLAKPLLATEVDANSIKNILAQVKAESRQVAPDAQMDNEIIKNSTHDDSKNHETKDAYPIAELKKTDSLSNLDNLPAALKSYLKTPEQRQAEKEDIKANSRLRWLAFYYLSRREHSAGELRQKLLDKEQDPTKIDELLAEFKDKGYQSDYRTAMMLIREGIRKHYGRVRIKNDFYKRKVALPSNIDELIDMAMNDNAAFVDVVSEHELVDGVDWLRLAVEARVKKYGDNIPIEPKEKARQLRFLQYRGFKPDICFAAINHTLDTLEERF